MGITKFESGQIVYWHGQRGNDHKVMWGMVDDQVGDIVYIDMLEPVENRFIVIGNESTPINDFPTVSRWRKLPKGWSYNTELFRIEYNEYPKDITINIKDPQNLIALYKSGWLVKSSTKFQGTVEAEIDKKEGWRVVKKYPYSIYDKQISTTIYTYKLYTKYSDAQNEVDAYYKELKRQSELSDLEWNIEQITRTLDYWGYLYGIPQDEKESYLNWILALDNVEDIEVRISQSLPQWKYWKNKRWNNIEL